MTNIFLIFDDCGNAYCTDTFENFVELLEKELDVDFCIFNKDGTKLIRGIFDYHVSMRSVNSVNDLICVLEEEEDYPFQKELVKYFKKKLESLVKIEEMKKKEDDKNKKKEEYELYLKLKEKYEKE